MSFVDIALISVFAHLMMGSAYLLWLTGADDWAELLSLAREIPEFKHLDLLLRSMDASGQQVDSVMVLLFAFVVILTWPLWLVKLW